MTQQKGHICCLNAREKMEVGPKYRVKCYLVQSLGYNGIRPFLQGQPSGIVSDISLPRGEISDTIPEDISDTIPEGCSRRKGLIPK